MRQLSTSPPTTPAASLKKMCLAYLLERLAVKLASLMSRRGHVGQVANLRADCNRPLSDLIADFSLVFSDMKFLIAAFLGAAVMLNPPRPNRARSRSIVDEAVSSGLIPGAVLLIGHNDQIIFPKLMARGH